MREEKDMENKTEAQCLYELAMKHIYGDGVPEDNELAVKLLTRAKDMGHVRLPIIWGFAITMATERQSIWERPMNCTCILQTAAMERAWNWWGVSITGASMWSRTAHRRNTGFGKLWKAQTRKLPWKRKRNFYMPKAAAGIICPLTIRQERGRIISKSA